MDIKSLDLNSIIFMYAVLSHGSLATIYTNYIKKTNTKRVIYFLGHVFITCAFIFRIFPKYRGSITDTAIGITGHSCLLLFFIITTFITTGKYVIAFNTNSDYNWLNILCIIGQVGMISIYTIEYLKENEQELYNKYKDYYKYIYIFTFALLAYFYIRIAFKKQNNLFIPLVMVSILYSILLYKPIHDNIFDIEKGIKFLEYEL